MHRLRLALITISAISVVGLAQLSAQRGGRRGTEPSASPAKVPAWRGDAEVAGKITDEAGKGVPDAKVVFVFVAANEGFFATTKKSGEFTAKEVKTGQWRVQVEVPN